MQMSFPGREHWRIRPARFKGVGPRLVLLLCSILLPLAQPTMGADVPKEAPTSSGHGLWLQLGAGKDQVSPGAAPAKDLAESYVDPVTGHVFRVAYLIPTNRTAQPNAVANLRHVVLQYQGWYRDQMQRHGFGPRTFVYEVEPDGKTPKVYTLKVNETDADLRSDIWGRTLSAASSVGVPVWTAKQVWWLVPECHVQAADGSISGGSALGASYGSGDDAGVGLIGSDALARFAPAYFTNDTAYAGRVLPEIGPYPLVQSTSFPWFEGTTFSSISSSVLGAGIHELSHGLGQPHDFRNDENFKGNLMGNGLRGFRGALFPERYPGDYTRIGYGAALMLSASRYFNAGSSFTENTKPAVNVTTSGTNAPVNGHLQIAFSCSDAGGLHSAFLSRSGDLVGEMRLSGTSASTNFATPYYAPGETNQYTVTVLDVQGNRRSVERSIVPQTGFNRAPQPFITVAPPTAMVGQTVTLSATQSSDPDGSTANLKVEWDLDGDGTFDTSPTSNLTLSTPFTASGDRLVRARLTDLAGAQSLSTPMALRVTLPALTATKAGNVVRISWPATAGTFTLEGTGSLGPADWQTVTQQVIIVNGQRTVSRTNSVGTEYFRLKR